jgi:serine/threonine protein phosphatase 1
MTRVSLIGDVHGDVARLTAMLDIVEAETDRMVVLLGDYVNWGPDPAGVLELLSRRQVPLGDRLVLLEGNHDRAFREFLDGGDIALLLAMGGAATVRSYIGAARGELSGRLRASVPQSHIRVLKSLQPMWCTDDLLALHQWPEDHIEIGSRYAVLGHYPQLDHRPRIEEHAAYLDTGCGSDPDGVLTCLRFPEGDWHSL